MAVHWNPQNKSIKVPEVETMPRGGRLPDKPVSARGKRRRTKKNG